MTLRKWFYWFWTTLAFGTAAGVITGLLLLAVMDSFAITEGMLARFDVLTIFLIVIGGALISLLSQMGFFSFLIMRYLAVGIFRNRSTWELVQVILIVSGVVEVFYWTSYIVWPIALIAASLLVAYWKTKQTNRYAFIPTVFFMSVVTGLELVPAIHANSDLGILFMLVPLLVCNAWQIMLLHKLTDDKKEPSARPS